MVVAPNFFKVVHLSSTAAFRPFRRRGSILRLPLSSFLRFPLVQVELVPIFSFFRLALRE